MKRRKFLKNSSTITAGLISAPILASCQETKTENNKYVDSSIGIKPIVICTWNFQNATAKAWEILNDGGRSLDAVEQGVIIEEADVKTKPWEKVVAQTETGT